MAFQMFNPAPGNAMKICVSNTEQKLLEFTSCCITPRLDYLLTCLTISNHRSLSLKYQFMQRKMFRSGFLLQKLKSDKDNQPDTIQSLEIQIAEFRQLTDSFLDCEQSLFFYRFKRGRQPLPSRAISHARGHLRVLHFARRTTEKRETARSLMVFSNLFEVDV